MTMRRVSAAVRGLATRVRRAAGPVRWSRGVDRWRLFAIARWLAAVALGVWTVRQAILTGREESNLVFAALHALYAFAGLLTTVLLVSHELAGWVLTPLNRLIDAVLLPSGYEPPPADYTLARMYRQQRRHEEARDEYLKIIRHHPRELRAYLEGMAAAGEAGQTAWAARFFRRGQRVFRREDTRRKLQRALEVSCQVALLADEPDVGEAPAVEPEPAGGALAGVVEASPSTAPAGPPEP